VQAQAALGRAADVAETLARGDDPRDDWPVTAVWVMLDPRFAPVREELAVQRQVVARAAAEARRADAVFPRDPELRRAMTVLERDGTRTEYDLADQIVRTALERRPTDPEVLVVMARAQVTFLFRGFDRSEERFAAAWRSAERAVQLVPDEPEAVGALGIYFLVRGGADRPRALPLLRRAVALKPQSPFLRRFLNNAQSALVQTGGQELEPVAALSRGAGRAEMLAQLFPDDALVQYELALYYREKGDVAAMQQALDATLRLRPVANAHIWKANLALWQRGDVDSMRRILGEVTEAGRTFERYAISRWELAMVSGRVDEGLDVLRSLTSNWLEDFQYVGPKSLLIAELLAVQGKTSSARLEFEAALAAVRRERERTPNVALLHLLEGWALIGLGRAEEARPLAAAHEESLRRPYRVGIGAGLWHSIIAFHALSGSPAKAAVYLREAVTTHPLGLEAARAEYLRRFELDPRLRPQRDEPWVREALR
jgi:tetratricopeptide (TPR) repeat protein